MTSTTPGRSITSAHCCREQTDGRTNNADIATAQSILLYNYSMKLSRWLKLAFAFTLFACQSATSSTVTILDNGKILTLQTDGRVPSALLSQAGIMLNPNDRILLNGFPVALDSPITTYPITIQIRRALNITINTPQGQQQIQS